MEAAAFQAQNTNFPDTFAAGGQNSVNLLVNQLIATLEINLSLPLNFLLSPAFANRAVHGQVHSSTDALMGMKATLDGLHRFYLGEVGPGLDDYVRNVNPGLSRRLEAQFQATISAWAALDQPLETMAVTEPARLKAAWEQTHKLETLLRVDLVSTMGVTIMFNSYDGD
jgi:predicted lipoprotein